MDQTKKGLNSFQLKIIALFIMTIDHIAKFEIFKITYDTYFLMRIIGRIAAPLFLFMLVEGLRHTKSRAKYIIRLYIASALMQILATLPRVLIYPQNFEPMGNIFQTFFYAALLITCIDNIKKRESCKKVIISIILLIVTVIIAIIDDKYISVWRYLYIRHPWGPESFFDSYVIYDIFSPSPFRVEYSFLFVLLGITWYFINNKKINCVIFGVLSAISAVVSYPAIFESSIFYSAYNTFWHLFSPIQWLMVFAIPFILLYNGEKGRYNFKYFFYVYYPIHQVLFFIIGAARILQ